MEGEEGVVGLLEVGGAYAVGELRDWFYEGAAGGGGECSSEEDGGDGGGGRGVSPWEDAVLDEGVHVCEWVHTLQSGLRGRTRCKFRCFSLMSIL